MSTVTKVVAEWNVKVAGAEYDDVTVAVISSHECGGISPRLFLKVKVIVRQTAEIDGQDRNHQSIS